MTRRLYYEDSYLRAFPAEIVEVRPAAKQYHVYLDRTAFYPASGGQPFDTGRIAGAAVLDVLDQGERVAHVVETPLQTGPAACQVDWARRFDHMQQHSGQHLLSAVFLELDGCPTVGFHLGREASTIDLDAPALDTARIAAAEERANALVFENRPVTARFYSAEQAAALGLRKPSERSGDLRVVEIAECDRSACGGTHVRATGEIGPLLIRRLDRVRGALRVEFLCGGRAVRRARADYELLSRVAGLFSAPPDQAPSLVAARIEAAAAAEKSRQKLEAELAVFKGRDLYQTIQPDQRNRRIHQISERAGPLESWRPLAQSFASSGPGAVFLLAIEEPPAVLLAVSADSGLNAGKLLKQVLQPLGGRGGGSPVLAQGSLPDPARIPAALQALRDSLST